MWRAEMATRQLSVAHCGVGVVALVAIVLLPLAIAVLVNRVGLGEPEIDQIHTATVPGVHEQLKSSLAPGR